MAAEDDPGIGDDDLLHRRVLDREDMVVFDDTLQRWTPLNSAGGAIGCGRGSPLPGARSLSSPLA